MGPSIGDVEKPLTVENRSRNWPGAEAFSSQVFYSIPPGALNILPYRWWRPFLSPPKFSRKNSAE
jgi:hypothetical protein